MELKDKVAVVTGGASGIGRALCRRFAKEGARGVVAVDRDLEGAKAVAEETGGVAMAADVAIEEDIVKVVEETEKKFGRIDLFCSNAGIARSSRREPYAPSGRSESSSRRASCSS